jgi:hypothetical protein
MGWRFRVGSASDIEVAALGAFDSGGDGLVTNHTVAIWTTSGGTPLAQAVVPSGKAAFLDGHFRYVNVSPVRLIKDTEYIIGASEDSLGDRLAYWAQGFTNSSGVVYLAPRSAPTAGGLVFPTFESDTNIVGFSWFGGNFEFTPVPSVPHSTIRFSQVEFCWTSETNKEYQVQYSSTLTTNTWQNLGGTVQGTGTNNCIFDPIPRGEPQRYYQVYALP